MVDYNLKYECEYHLLLDDDIFEDGETNEKKDEIRLFAYQKDLRIIFNKGKQTQQNKKKEKEFQDKMNATIQDLFDKMQNEETIKEAIKMLKTYHPVLEGCGDVSFFMILFSSQYFFVTHLIICDFLKNKKVSDENGKNFLEFIKMFED
jgi:hypothetical protein